MGRVTTRTGDGGTTRLWDGTPVPKDDPRIRLNGALDETTSALGLARGLAPLSLKEDLGRLQREISGLMAYVARGKKDAAVPDAAGLESWIERLLAAYPVPDEFLFPGDTAVGGALHLARALSRRAERDALPLAREGILAPDAMRYLNRLSDMLFVLAVAADREAMVERITKNVLKTVSRENGSRSSLSRENAKRLLAAMELAAEQMGVPMVLAVCDGAGDPVAFLRMDGALPVSLTLAPKKARTAVRLRMTTAQLTSLVQPGAMLYGLTGDPDIVAFGGGIPLRRGDEVCGGVGVSGGSVEQDIAIAEAALAAWNENE